MSGSGWKLPGGVLVLGSSLINSPQRNEGRQNDGTHLFRLRNGWPDGGTRCSWSRRITHAPWCVRRGRGNTMNLRGGSQNYSLARVGDSVTIKDRKSTRLNSSHVSIAYAVFCLKKKTV